MWCVVTLLQGPRACGDRLCWVGCWGLMHGVSFLGMGACCCCAAAQTGRHSIQHTDMHCNTQRCSGQLSAAGSDGSTCVWLTPLLPTAKGHAPSVVLHALPLCGWWWSYWLMPKGSHRGATDPGDSSVSSILLGLCPTRALWGAAAPPPAHAQLRCRVAPVAHSTSTCVTCGCCCQLSSCVGCSSGCLSPQYGWQPQHMGVLGVVCLGVHFRVQCRFSRGPPSAGQVKIDATGLLRLGCVLLGRQSL